MPKHSFIQQTLLPDFFVLLLCQITLRVSVKTLHAAEQTRSLQLISHAKAKIPPSNLKTLLGSLNRWLGHCRIIIEPIAIQSPNGLAFVYMSDLLTDGDPIRPLTSPSKGLVTVPKIRSKAAGGAFSSCTDCTQVEWNFTSTVQKGRVQHGKRQKQEEKERNRAKKKSHSLW